MKVTQLLRDPGQSIFFDLAPDDSLSNHRYTKLVAGEKGPDFTAMDRARELERVECLRQSSWR